MEYKFFDEFGFFPCEKDLKLLEEYYNKRGGL